MRKHRRPVLGGRKVAAGVLLAALTAAASQAFAQTAADRFADERFECLIEPSLTVKLGTPVEGIVAEVLVDRADRIKAGQVVARMEARVETALLALARARAENAAQVASTQTRYGFLTGKADRLLGLLEKSIGSKAAYDEARAEADVAHEQFNEAVNNQKQAKLDQDRAAATLDLRTIVSPIDGVVTERLMAPGEYRNGQAHLATIARLDPLHVEVVVPGAYYGLVQLGIGGEIEADPPIASIPHGIVTVIDQTLDPKTGTFGVRLDLANADYKIPSGLACHVKFLRRDAAR